MSGFDSRGVNTMINFTTKNQTTDDKSVFILAETTASLRVGAGKQISVVF